MGMTEKATIGLCFITIELLLMSFFSLLTYIINKELLAVGVMCGFILITFSPLLYIIWQLFPSEKDIQDEQENK
jgi:hypothetical protein